MRHGEYRSTAAAAFASRAPLGMVRPMLDYENRDVCEAMGRAALARVRSVISLDSYGPRAAAAYQSALDAVGKGPGARIDP
jgi:hypothetical protein